MRACVPGSLDFEPSYTLPRKLFQIVVCLFNRRRSLHAIGAQYKLLARNRRSAMQKKYSQSTAYNMENRMAASGCNVVLSNSDSWSSLRGAQPSVVAVVKSLFSQYNSNIKYPGVLGYKLPLPSFVRTFDHRQRKVIVLKHPPCLCKSRIVRCADRFVLSSRHLRTSCPQTWFQYWRTKELQKCGTRTQPMHARCTSPSMICNRCFTVLQK